MDKTAWQIIIYAVYGVGIVASLLANEGGAALLLGTMCAVDLIRDLT